MKLAAIVDVHLDDPDVRREVFTNATESTSGIRALNGILGRLGAD